MLARCDNRHVLFLQGTGSRFFACLADKLQGLDIETSKIHLCFGDWLFWRRKSKTNCTTSYRGTRQNWSTFVQDYILERGVTDIVLFSDSRSYHSVAAKVAKSMGVNVFVFENGYVRPSWITMERDGVNGRSNFPRDRDEIRNLCIEAAKSTVTFPGGSPSDAMKLYFGDTTFHTLNFAFGLTFPNYKGFRDIHALQEARGWITKAIFRRGKVKRSKQALEKLFAGNAPMFFFPLQLEHDYQLKIDSPFDTLEQATNKVIASFAANAPADALLLVKNHPLDNNIIDREVETARLAGKHGIADRIIFIEAGSNPEILKRSRGMVTINSTMGTAALFHKVPMCVLGDAIYNIKGLVHDGGLDSFWQSSEPFDLEFSLIFREALIYFCQIQGHYSETDKDAGVFEHCAAKILTTNANSPHKPVDVSNVAEIDNSSGGAPAQNVEKQPID